MCTIIVATQVWPGRPLVVAANRDELLDRPASAPQVWAAGELAERRALAPRDLRAGGTWLGVNDAGLFVGITNRRAVADPGRRSRGELVLEALGASDQREARSRIAGFDAREYNPFHLLFADRRGASVVWSDGERLQQLALEPGIHWITERSFGAAASERHAILEGWRAQVASGPAPDLNGWRSILADHRPHQPKGRKPDSASVGFDSLCVHADPFNYGTRSSTLVELGDEPGSLRFFHASGRPCEVPLVELGDAVERLAGKLCANSAPG